MEHETSPRSPTPEPASSMSQALEGLLGVLDGHDTLAAARGITEKALDSMYGVARELYVNGHPAEALAAFELLCLYDHVNARHWQGLAACRQATRDYAGAAGALAFAVGQTAGPVAELNLQLAECLIADGSSDAAEQVLRSLDEPAANAVRNGPLASKVRVLRDQLRQLSTGGTTGDASDPSTVNG